MDIQCCIGNPIMVQTHTAQIINSEIIQLTTKNKNNLLYSSS